jgi:uncharacterized protein
MLDFNNRYVQWGVKASVVAVGLLAVFLLSKTISEIVSWGKDEMYPTRTVTVMAEGEAMATADIASFSFSVNEEGATSEEAQGKASTKIDQALKYLEDNGVEEKDIKTEYYNINPKYENLPCTPFNCPTGNPKIIGYEVSQSIKVKVRDTDNAGKFLSEMTQFGINNVSGLAFTIDDEDVLYDAARQDAIEKAEAKGEQLAKDLGVRLGKVVSFSEDNPALYYGGEMYEADMMKSAVAPQARNVSLPQGENTYTTRVYVTYELK